MPSSVHGHHVVWRLSWEGRHGFDIFGNVWNVKMIRRCSMLICRDNIYKFMQIEFFYKVFIFFLPSSCVQRHDLHLRRIQRAARHALQRSPLLRSGEQRLAPRRDQRNVAESAKAPVVHRHRQEDVFVRRNMVSSTLTWFSLKRVRCGLVVNQSQITIKTKHQQKKSESKPSPSSQTSFWRRQQLRWLTQSRFAPSLVRKNTTTGVASPKMFSRWRRCAHTRKTAKLN